MRPQRLVTAGTGWALTSECRISLLFGLLFGDCSANCGLGLFPLLTLPISPQSQVSRHEGRTPLAIRSELMVRGDPGDDPQGLLQCSAVRGTQPSAYRDTSARWMIIVAAKRALGNLKGSSEQGAITV